MAFIAKKQRGRVSAMPMAEYKAWYTKQVDEYGRTGGMLTSSDEENLEIDDEAKYRRAIGNDLFASSSLESPVSPQLLMEELKKQLGNVDDLTERLAPIRRNFSDQLFIKEGGDIPSNLKLPAPPQICERIHPGVCREDITFRIRTAVDALKMSVQTWIPGFGFLIEAVNNRTDGPATHGEYLFLACVTPYVVLAQLDIVDGLQCSSIEKVMVDMFKEGDPNTFN